MKLTIKSAGPADLSENDMSYGCHNRREYKPKVMVQDGWWMDGQSRTAKMVTKPFAMTKDCQYTKSALGQADTGCTGCRHRLDTVQKA